MPRVLWPLVGGRPAVEVILPLGQGAQLLSRILLADTGAGSLRAPAELIVAESDCLQSGGIPGKVVTLGGAYAGSFPTYAVRLQVPALGFDRTLRVVGAAGFPTGFHGIACFRFLNRFAYGNFGDPSQFGLEV